MSHPKFKLYRQKITPEDRAFRFHIKEHDTHLISIEIMICGQRWSTDVVAIFPAQLKKVTKILHERIMEAYEDHIQTKKTNQ